MQISSSCLISLKRTPRLRAWRAIIMLRLFNCTAMEITGKHQSCCWLNDLCQEFPFHHQAFSLLKYESYKIKRIIKNCFLSFKNTKNMVLFRNWQEKKCEKARSSRPEVFRKKRCFWKFRKPKVLSCECCDIFKNTFFHRAPPVAASEKLKAEAVVQRCSVKKVLVMLYFPIQTTCKII